MSTALCLNSVASNMSLCGPACCCLDKQRLVLAVTRVLSQLWAKYSCTCATGSAMDWFSTCSCRDSVFVPCAASAVSSTVFEAGVCKWDGLIGCGFAEHWCWAQSVGTALPSHFRVCLCGLHPTRPFQQGSDLKVTHVEPGLLLLGFQPWWSVASSHPLYELVIHTWRQASNLLGCTLVCVSWCWRVYGCLCSPHGLVLQAYCLVRSFQECRTDSAFVP